MFLIFKNSLLYLSSGDQKEQMMQGRIAVVTGGMGGIGTAICQSLSREGAKVIVGFHRSHDKAKIWEDEQKKLGFEFRTNYVDVTDYESTKAFISQLLERYGQIDILVNNAGITRDSQLKKMSAETWCEVIETNLTSVFNLTQNVVNAMIEKRYGRIINISSINGQKGQFGQTNYAAAKAGMHGFTKSLAQELAAKGITVNTISPGYIGTEMVRAMDEKIVDSIVAQIPVGRLGEPEEVARCVSFLASDASGFMTGSNLMINGGQYLL